MKLILFRAIFFLACCHAAHALHCMQGATRLRPNGKDMRIETYKMQNHTECSSEMATLSASFLHDLKPVTATEPSTDYKCFHLRFYFHAAKKTVILKGCIYKEQDVCDGYTRTNNIEQVFCSQCDQDDCNSADQLASNWKILFFTVCTIMWLPRK